MFHLSPGSVKVNFRIKLRMPKTQTVTEIHQTVSNALTSGGLQGETTLDAVELVTIAVGM